LWHRPQLSLVIKNVAGMMPRTLVSADDGKNGLSGPAPSSCMLCGGVSGLTMRYFARRAWSSRAAPTTDPAMVRHSAAQIPPNASRRRPNVAGRIVAAV
jgi:hypothetical protein